MEEERKRERERGRERQKEGERERQNEREREIERQRERDFQKIEKKREQAVCHRARERGLSKGKVALNAVGYKKKEEKKSWIQKERRKR